MPLNLSHNNSVVIHRLTATYHVLHHKPFVPRIHARHETHVNRIPTKTIMTTGLGNNCCLHSHRHNWRSLLVLTIFRRKLFLWQKCDQNYSNTNRVINRRLISISSHIFQQPNDGQKPSAEDSPAADFPETGAAYTSSSESSSGDMTSDDEDLFREPPKVRFGLLKVALTIIVGTYAGAMFARFGANVLEEYEIFVKGDDDDDD